LLIFLFLVKRKVSRNLKASFVEVNETCLFCFLAKGGMLGEGKIMKRKTEMNIIRYFDTLARIGKNFIVKE